METAAEMRRKALEVRHAIMGKEWQDVRARIEEAVEGGSLSVTYYEPISGALLRELGELGYDVRSKSSAPRNEVEWVTTISWEKPHGRGDSYPVNSMQRD